MTDPGSPDQDAPSFEAALESLSAVVAQLESGSLGLSDSIAAYERGVALLRRLHKELSAIEARVDQLVRIDEDGRPVFSETEPTTGSASDESADSSQPPRSLPSRSQPPRASSRGRSRRLPGMDDVAADS